jgi:hypothetical protein
VEKRKIKQEENGKTKIDLFYKSKNNQSKMGVRGFLSFLKPIRKKIQFPKENLRVGIDAFCLMYFFREERKNFETYLIMLQDKGYELTFVFDRRAQKEKKAVVESRKQRKEEAKQEADILLSFTQTEEYQDLDKEFQKSIQEKLNQKEHESWCLYAEYTEWLTTLLQNKKISIVKAKEEADICLAKGEYDVIISSDTDMFVLGCRRVWMPLSSTSVYEYNLQEVEQHVGLPHESFCELAFLVGCDVQPKQKMEMEEAISNLRFYGSLLSMHTKQPKKVSMNDLELFASLKKEVWN